MITLNQLNNLELYYPNKLFKVFSFDMSTVKNIAEFSDIIYNNTIGYIKTNIKTNVKIAILIFKDSMDLNTLLKYVSENNIDYHMEKYTYRTKTYLNNLFNENDYTSNINI